jgi:hypothetical protein
MPEGSKMKTPQQIRNEVEKGCGEKNIFNSGFNCGEMGNFGEIVYCSSCQAKLDYKLGLRQIVRPNVSKRKRDSNGKFLGGGS